MKDVSKMSEDDLCGEFVDWCRIARNEGKLPTKDRERLRAVVAELTKRGITFK